MAAPLSKSIDYKKIPSFKYSTVNHEYQILCPGIKPKNLVKYECDYLVFDIDGTLTIKIGYAWDGCSGPTRDDATNMRAGLVHDALYQLMRKGAIDREAQKRVDTFFRQIMLEDGLLLADNWRESILAVTRAWGYYRGVRIAGEKYTKPDPELDKVHTAPIQSKNNTGNDRMTQLEIRNPTSEDVEVFVTLGATDGCLQDVTQIPWVTKGSDKNGSFTLKSGDTAKAWAPANLGFNGVLSFGTPPMNCPPPQDFPNGINIFEFMINNGFQAGNPQETIDISCVAGVNTPLKVDLSGGGDWNASASNPKVTSFHNGDIYNNTGLVGVYPFKCDVCTGSVSPPDCGDGKLPASPQSAPICNVQRTPGTEGLVVVTFNGGFPTQ